MQIIFSAKEQPLKELCLSQSLVLAIGLAVVFPPWIFGIPIDVTSHLWAVVLFPVMAVAAAAMPKKSKSRLGLRLSAITPPDRTSARVWLQVTAAGCIALPTGALMTWACATNRPVLSEFVFIVALYAVSIQSSVAVFFRVRQRMDAEAQSEGRP